MGGMSGNGSLDGTEKTAEEWARLLDSSQGGENSVKESAYLFSSGLLDEYDEDTLKLNSEYTGFDEGSRVGTVEGKDVERNTIERRINIEVVDSKEMYEPFSMAEMEEEIPSYRSGQIIFYTLMPEGYENDGSDSDSITGSSGQENINMNNGGFNIDHPSL